jgi:MFS family permease
MRFQVLHVAALTATAVFSACQMMAFVLFPYFSQSTGLSLSTIIGSFSLGSLLFLWGSPYWARKSDQWGSRGVLALGIIGLLLSQLFLFMMLSGVQPSSAWLWGSRIIYGLTASAIVPVTQKVMAQGSSAHTRMRAMTRHGMSLQLGRLLGPFLVWLGLLISMTAPLVICMALLLIPAALILMAQGESRGVNPKKEAPLASWKGLVMGRRYLGLAFLMTSLVGILQSSLTQELQMKLQLDAQAAAQLTLQFLLASSLVTLLIQALVQIKITTPWQGTFPAGALSLVISCYLLAQFQSESELWWALPLFATGIALLTPSYTAALSLQFSGAQGTLAGFLSIAHTLGYACGGLLAAALFAAELPVLTAALVCALILLLAVFVLPKPKSNPICNLTCEPRDAYDT